MARDILIVDDEADIRMLIGGILSDEGYQTRAAGDSASRSPPSVPVNPVWSFSTSGWKEASTTASIC